MYRLKNLSRVLFPSRHRHNEIVAALGILTALTRINFNIGASLMEDFSALSSSLDDAQAKIDALQDSNQNLFDTVTQMAADILALRSAGTPVDNQTQIDALQAKAQKILDGINKAKTDVESADSAAEVVEPPVVTPPAPPVDTPPADTPPADQPPADAPPADVPPTDVKVDDINTL